MQLRCSSRLHGEVDGDTVEVSCRSTFCGAGKGTVVLHTFNIKTGALVKTERFRNPGKESSNGNR